MSGHTEFSAAHHRFLVSGACVIYGQLNHTPCDFYLSSVNLGAMNKSLAVCCTDWLHLFRKQRKVTPKSPSPSSHGDRGAEFSRSGINSFWHAAFSPGVRSCCLCPLLLSRPQLSNHEKQLLNFQKKLKSLEYVLTANQICESSSSKRGFQSEDEYCHSKFIQQLSRTFKKWKTITIFILILFNYIRPT